MGGHDKRIDNHELIQISRKDAKAQRGNHETNFHYLPESPADSIHCIIGRGTGSR
jgi:hypothetical protein